MLRLRRKLWPITICVIVSVARPVLSTWKEQLVNYNHAQVWRTMLRCQKDVEMFRTIRSAISIWSLNQKRADYLVLDKDRLRVYQKLAKRNLTHTVLIMNVQKRIDTMKLRAIPWTDSSLRIGHRMNFQNYPSIHIMDEFLNYLKDNYPSIIRISSIGNSIENRTIKMIHITNGDPSNKIMVVVAGQHAREWVGITSALYIIHNLVTKYDKQPDYMKNKDWYIVPLLNPDGYAYTQTTDRLWRKNRRRNNKNNCVGVDLNRNYPKHWQVYGITQNDACEEDYGGPFALSEPESLAVLNMLDSIGPKVPSAFVDLHAYGQLIMYPWGVEGKISQHRDALASTGELIRSTIQNVTGHKYTYGSPAQLLYAVSGTAIDWFHSKGVALSFAIESRDTGAHGFLLPPHQIMDAGKEMLGAVRSIAKVLNTDIVMRDGSQHRWF